MRRLLGGSYWRGCARGALPHSAVVARRSYGDDAPAMPSDDDARANGGSGEGAQGGDDGGGMAFIPSGGSGFVNIADFLGSGIHGPAPAGVRRDFDGSKWRADLHDERAGKCIVCDEEIKSWSGHTAFVSHQARMGILDRVMSGACGPVNHIVARWWKLLNLQPDGAQLPRLRPLSSDFTEERRQRLIYLLRFLQGNGILKVALGVYNDETKEFGRSNVFERFEMVGDNVVKCVFFDRLQALFPLTDGGVTGKLVMIQQLIDSNEGLLQAFDYLELGKIIGWSLSQSKFKSDVMEALFGELQTYLWAVAQQWDGPVEYSPLHAAAGPEMVYVEAVVRHALLELTDVILMFAVESTVTRARKFLDREYRGGREPKPIGVGGLAHARSARAGATGRCSAVDHDPELFDSLTHGRYDARPYLTEEPVTRGRDGEAASGAASARAAQLEIGVSVLKPLAERLAEAARRREDRQTSWLLPAPLFSAAKPAEQAALLGSEFTAGAVDAAVGAQLPVRCAHLDRFTAEQLLLDCVPFTPPLARAATAAALSAGAAAAHSAGAVGWWCHRSVTCSWRSLAPALLGARALRIEPALSPCVFACPASDNESDERGAMEASRHDELDVVHVALHQACAERATCDVSSSPLIDDAHDFSFSELAPVWFRGSLCWDALRGGGEAAPETAPLSMRLSRSAT